MTLWKLEDQTLDKIPRFHLSWRGNVLKMDKFWWVLMELLKTCWNLFDSENFHTRNLDHILIFYAVKYGAGKINPFVSNAPFLYTLKKGALGTNGLICLASEMSLLTTMIYNLSWFWSYNIHKIYSINSWSKSRLLEVLNGGYF